MIYVLLLSILVQSITAIQSLKLIKTTGKARAWICISLAFILMALRRIEKIYKIFSIPQQEHKDILGELVALGTSILMMIGVIWIYPLFNSIKEMNIKLKKTNRALKTISECNQAIVHISDEIELKQEVCRLIVEFGGFGLVWIGCIKQNSKEFHIDAKYGQERNILNRIDSPLYKEKKNDDPVRKVIETGTFSIENINVENFEGEEISVGTQKSEYRASVHLPLKIDDDVIGVLNIYSLDPNVFDIKEINFLNELSSDLSFAINDIRAKEQKALIEKEKDQSERKYQMLFECMQEGFALNEIIYGEDGKPVDYRFVEINPGFEKQTGLKRSSIIGKKVSEIFPDLESSWIKTIRNVVLQNREEIFEDYIRSLDKYFMVNLFKSQKEKIAAVFFDVTEKKKNENIIRSNEARIRNALENFPDMVILYDPNLRITFINSAVINVTNKTANEFIGYIEEEIWPSEVTREYLPTLEKTLATGKTQSVVVDLNFPELGLEQRILSINYIPLFDHNNEIIEIMGIAHDLTESKRAEEQIHSQIERLSALRQIDISISGSLDLRIVLEVILNQCIRQLKVDAARIYTFNRDFHVLEYKASKGFLEVSNMQKRMKIGETLAGNVVLERKRIHVQNMEIHGNDFQDIPDNEKEGFVSYYGVPLISKGEVRGVLEVYQRSYIKRNSDWENFLETLAGQAAIAIENIEQFENLNRLNTELTLAYDKILEGWTSSLELRGADAKGHTMRVAEKTVDFAKRMGIKDEELIHIRQGALLHDIGKMGIPDSILHKTGKLTKEEKEIMKQHPDYAFKILSKIQFLNKAIDIPYCHHEKWDGSGYPRGLKGVQIPLPARIFAVVDVWDALQSDRPGHKAWTKEKVIEYIKSQSGKYFDPNVVNEFLKYIKQINDLKKRSHINPIG